MSVIITTNTYERFSTTPGMLLYTQSMFFSSCYYIKKDPPLNSGLQKEAYVPVYAVDSAPNKIVGMAPQPTKNAGKIYVYGNLLFQVENLVGIHVINYADKANPVKIGFIKSRGCSEIAVKGGYLIANNMTDLVTIDIRQPDKVVEASRIKNAFPQFYVDQYTNSKPPEKGKYYVCPMFNTGEIIGWKLEKNVSGAYCYNN